MLNQFNYLIVIVMHQGNRVKGVAECQGFSRELKSHECQVEEHDWLFWAFFIVFLALIEVKRSLMDNHIDIFPEAAKDDISDERFLVSGLRIVHWPLSF